MIKRRIFAAFLSTGILMSPMPAFAHHGEALYDTVYYSDATYTVQVGYDPIECLWNGPINRTHNGQSSNYVQYQFVGYCAQHQSGQWYWEPFY